jgi:hypothetical protein
MRRLGPFSPVGTSAAWRAEYIATIPPHIPRQCPKLLIKPVTKAKIKVLMITVL